MKIKKLNQQGNLHYLIPILFVLIISLIGVRILTATHAATVSDNIVPTVENVSYQNKALPPYNLMSQSQNETTNKIGYGQCYKGLSVPNCYFYNNMIKEDITANGAEVSFSQAQPRLNPADFHSLTELSVASVDGKQVIEIGWTVDPTMNHDSKPHLFVFRWVNGAPSCYNGCGFIPTTLKYKAGGPIKVGVIGKYGIKYSKNRWNLTYNNTNLGYFPESIWGGTFKKVGRVLVFGEVSSSSMSTPHSQMGNGILGTNPRSAVISGMRLLGSTDHKNYSYTSNEAPDVYKIGNTKPYCITSCSMHYGGPGYN